MPIHVLLTGGTIDKHYHECNGELSFSETHLPTMLAQARCTLDLHMDTLMLKDSLAMQDSDRQTILNACQQSPHKMIVITHGTDTMVDSAQVLGQALQQQTLQDKTIVLLGAMIPYELKQSDSLFNLGSALTAAQCLTQGVYICMNGQVFSWDNVMKNRGKGVFCEQNP
ncbi:MAG TPA: asparaginase, partial [Thiothrix sp.]|nr:asparaginase [Thiothrix sp.]